MATATELARKLEQKQGEMDGFLKSHRNEKGDLDFKNNDDNIKAFNDRNDELAKIHDEWKSAYEVEVRANKLQDEIKTMREISREPNRTVPFSSEGGDGSGTQTMGGMAPYYSGGAVKSMGQLFLESEEYKANAGNTPSSGTWKVEIPHASVSQNHSIKATLTTSTAVVPYGVQRAGIVDYATRRPVMRDLVPVDDPQGQNIIFIRQNTQTFGTDIVAEGAAKPETTLGTERVSLTLEAIAHFIKVTDQALRFIPGIQGLIDRKGTLGIELKEEDSMLNYNGSAGWKGFLQQTGVQSSAIGSNDQFTAFHQGMNLVQHTGFANVTGGVINNTDWHKVVTTKDDNGRFIYGDPFAATREARIWGVPLVVTSVMTEGTVLVGDFVMDSRWWVAGGIIVKVGYVNDDLTKNQQTIVVEEYGALEISRPASFVKMTGWEAIA